MQVHKLFPTPVFESHIDVDLETINTITTLEYQRAECNEISSCRTVLELLPELSEEILQAAKYYMYTQLNIYEHITPYIARSWATRHTEHDTAKLHCHSNAIFSGVYYINAPRLTGAITFHDPYNTTFNPVLTPDYSPNELTEREYTICPTNGMLLIFPSHLQHSVTKNLTPKARYCIGFDLFISGTYGDAIGSRITT
mgnify:CR=1 FL=1